MSDTSNIEQMDRIHDSNTIPFTMIPHEIVRDNTIFGDIYEKMIYFVLKSHAVNGNGAFPSYATIAKEAQCSRDKAIKCVKSLVAKKLITKNTRKNSEGNQGSNMYTIEKFDSGLSKRPEVVVDNDQVSLSQRLGVVADNDQVSLSQRLGVVVDNDQGSISQRPPVVADNDPKNNPFKNNPLSKLSSSERAENNPDELSKLVSFFQKEIGLATSFIIDDLQHTLEDATYDMIQYALEQCVLNDVRNWKYAKKIIGNLLSKKLYTRQAIELHESKRQDARSSQGFKTGRRSQRSVSEMKEPSWLAKEKEEQKAFEAKQQANFVSDVPDDTEIAEMLRLLQVEGT